MTTQITQTKGMTEGQRKQMKRFLEDVTSGKNLDEILDSLGFSKKESQEILEKGDLIQNELKASITALLEKYAGVDQCFGSSLVEFDFTVPTYYNHDTMIDQYCKELRRLKKNYRYNSDLTSEHFAGVTTKLQPGKTYRVKFFPVLSKVTSETCIAFLKKQHAILVGAQGLFLVHNHQENKFPAGKWVVSFDQKDALWKDIVGKHRTPCVFHLSDVFRQFDLGFFENECFTEHCLLCFCEK